MAKRRTGDTLIEDMPGGMEQQDRNQGGSTAEGRDSREHRGSVTTDEIAERAYEIYQARGSTDGQDMDDWLRAERELREERERFESRERGESRRDRF